MRVQDQSRLHNKFEARLGHTVRPSAKTHQFRKKHTNLVWWLTSVTLAPKEVDPELSAWIRLARVTEQQQQKPNSGLERWLSS